METSFHKEKREMRMERLAWLTFFGAVAAGSLLLTWLYVLAVLLGR